jgi:uncharacterized protein YdeI (BOF family)
MNPAKYRTALIAAAMLAGTSLAADAQSSAQSSGQDAGQDAGQDSGQRKSTVDDAKEPHRKAATE